MPLEELDTNSPEDFLGADRGTKNHLAVSTGHRAHHQGSSNRRNKKRKHQRHIPFGPPGKPTVTVSPRNERLYVTWSITDNRGRPTDKYQVQWKTSEQEYSTSRQHTVDNRETTISSLSNGTQYVVRVRASNDGGTVYGDWSSAALGNPQPLPVLGSFIALWPSRGATRTSISTRPKTRSR